MPPEYRLADALRTVAIRLEQAVASGQRSKQIDADDLRETLLAVADLLDAPVTCPCPACGEHRQDELVFRPSGLVACQTCGGEFHPHA
jgi:hypothetical protein